MEKYQVCYQDTSFEYFIERKNVKNVNVNVKPDRTIVVSANDNVPLAFIEELLVKKAKWIEKQLSTFEKTAPEVRSQREYVSGETHRYLGRQYRLRIFKANELEEVKYVRGFIHLYVSDTSNQVRKRTLLDNWYRERAAIVFNELLNKVYITVAKYEIDKPAIWIRSMKARWGSALIPHQAIQLNLDLIKGPKTCIEYVILHELIHFKYNDHSKEFYDMLNALMPDWQDRKKILDEEVVKNL